MKTMSRKMVLLVPVALVLIMASGCLSDLTASTDLTTVSSAACDPGYTPDNQGRCVPNPISTTCPQGTTGTPPDCKPVTPPCTPRPQHPCPASVNKLAVNPPPHGYGPGGTGEAITPDIAQQFFKAAGLSPGDIPGANGTIFQRTVNLADVVAQQPGVGAELSKDGAVQGYEQAFYTGAFGSVVVGFAVFNTPDGAASWLTYLTNAALPMGQHIAAGNGLTATPQNYHSVDIFKVGDQSAGIEITGTWSLGSVQDQPFVVDVGLARRGLVQYGVAVERTGAGGDILSALNGTIKTLDAKVAAAITSLDLEVPAGPATSYPAGWVLVAAPGGTTFSGAQGSLYTLQARDDAYESLSPTTGVTAGEGYWAYFAGPVTVALAGQSTSNAAIQAPAGVWVMIGNPSATDTLGVHGADTVLVYDAAAGQYGETTTLKPGQGAWAMSLSGGTITIGP